MNKYQEVLNELKDLVHSELDGTKMLNKYLVYCNTLQDFIDQNKPLTLDECIKEWKEKGWGWDEYKREIVIYEHKSMKQIFIDRKDNTWWSEFYISFEFCHLLSKTLKALERENKR